MEMPKYVETKINEMCAHLLTIIKDSVKDLVCDAWEEGKKSANTDNAEEFAREIVEQVKKSIIVPYEIKLPEPPPGGWYPEPNSSKQETDKWMMTACSRCGNNPANGGSGICHCILGTSPIT